VTGLRARLRALPVLSGTAPEDDFAQYAADPRTQFTRWLDTAIAAGVREPHAMTLSTVDTEGLPDARIVILKDLDEAGWHFGVRNSSANGRQLAATHVAALTFYWPEQVRQVRVRGVVRRDAEAVRIADFQARSASAQAASGLADWVSYAVRPRSVEFWQGAVDRRHLRLHYLRSDGGWVCQ